MPRPVRVGIDPTAVLDPDSRVGEAAALGKLLDSLKYDPDEVFDPIVSPEQMKEEAATMAADLRLFIRAAWRLVEPSAFIPNWHIDAIAEMLMAVSAGSIRDFLITMPPRHSKSLIVSVLWPVWEWITLPGYRWVFASYAFQLSVRDSIKRRKVLQSKWFRDRWGNKFHLIDEQNSKIRYENDKHGFQLASSVGGSNTGEGGERIIADDPHNIKKTESEEVRQDTVDWWNIVMSTRRNDEIRSVRGVVQQRTHEGDVAGDIIEKGGYVHLNLPTEFGFAGAVRCQISWTDKKTGLEHKWEDPRTEPGELLNPARFSAEANEKAKIDLGDYQYAAQHGQNPTPPSGQIIQAAWLRYYGGPGQPPIPDWTRSTHPFTPLLSIDCTFKEHKDTDFVCMLGWAMFGADIYLLPIRVHLRLSFSGTIDALAEMVGGSNLDNTQTWPGIYPFMKLKVVEDKANGSAIIDTMRHKITGLMAYEPGGASKESRLQAASWRFRAGNIHLPHESIAPWIKEYVYELCAFPKARKDDYVDATSQALLVIGGDSKVEGEPAVPLQESRWFGIVAGDLEAGSGERSIWSALEGGGGATGRGSASIWSVGNSRVGKWR